jgi:hypothetical protein
MIFVTSSQLQSTELNSGFASEEHFRIEISAQILITVTEIVR